jgi:AbiV family abortive infection protein
MGEARTRRRYRNALSNVEAGFRACWSNANDLLRGADQLLESKLHAPALSLSVLALEELAKLSAIDGLLFARADDGKAEVFRKSTRSHSLKLSIFEMFPLMLHQLALVDPRYGSEERFNQAIATSISHLKEDGNAVMEELGSDAFQELDGWKQKGFYVTATGSGFSPPGDVVSEDLAKKVRQLAWRATTTLDFLLKEGNLERYFENAASIRSKLSEADHLDLEKRGQEMANSIFQLSEEEQQG